MQNVLPAKRSTKRREDTFDAGAGGIFANMWRLSGDGGPHAHDFLEIAVIAAGSGYHVSPLGRSQAVPGRVFILRPGAWHWYTECNDLVCANCCLSVEALAGPLAFLRFIPRVEQLLWRWPMAEGRHGVAQIEVASIDAESATRAIGKLSVALADNGAGGEITRSAAVLGVLGYLVDNDPSFDEAIGRPHAVNATVQLLEEFPEQDWSLESLAESVNLAPSYLARLFRRHIGLPPLGYLARLRAEKAALLLSTTDLSVGEIGGLVGWPDPNYFARRFRQLSGLSPSVYRQHSRAGNPLSFETGQGDTFDNTSLHDHEDNDHRKHRHQ